ncbi:hypothetical protein ACHAWF_014999 [Thalassiosira exigua]
MEEEERPTLRAALKKLRRSTYPRASKRAKAAAKDAGESAPDLGGAGTATDPVAAEDRTDLAEVPAVDAAGGAAGRGAERTTEEIEEASASAEGAPRVELDASGVLIVSGSSLARDPRDRVSATDVDREYGDAVVDDEDIQGNAGFDSHDGDGEGGPRKPKRWGVEETRTFFRALRTCGADFGLMGTYLPGRSRSQLKRKFRTESRKHPRLVDLALDPRGGGRLGESMRPRRRRRGAWGLDLSFAHQASLAPFSPLSFPPPPPFFRARHGAFFRPVRLRRRPGDPRRGPRPPLEDGDGGGGVEKAGAGRGGARGHAAGGRRPGRRRGRGRGLRRGLCRRRRSRGGRGGGSAGRGGAREGDELRSLVRRRR